MAQSSQNPIRIAKSTRILGWEISAIFIGLLIILPIFSVFYLAFFPSENIWGHLLKTVLPRYAFNSALLMLCVGAFAAILGAGTAWLVVICEFPGRKYLEWALLMPLAIPSYLVAYAMVDFLEYAGPVQTFIRSVLGFENARDYWFPEIRSRAGAVLILTLTLYPYVYLLARAAFREQSGRAFDVSRALGCGPLKAFWKAGLPLARPSVAAGVAVVMMETLNDFGTVEFFAVQTLTTGIFTVWLEANNAGGAAQIASILLIAIFLLMGLERRAMWQKRTTVMGKSASRIERRPLRGRWALLALTACCLPVIFGFLLPTGILMHLSAPEFAQQGSAFARAFGTSLVLGALTALVAVGAALLIVFSKRLRRGAGLGYLGAVAAVGYAAPGAVLAIGILIPVAAFENRIADMILNLTGYDPGLFFSGTIAILIFAYCVRFFAIAYGGLDAALNRLSPSLIAAAQSLGKTRPQVLFQVELPLIRASLVTTGLLIFVDTIKELPATLLLRPFGVETLATQSYTQASLENIGGAAPSGLTIALIGLIAVVLVSRSQK